MDTETDASTSGDDTTATNPDDASSTTMSDPDTGTDDDTTTTVDPDDTGTDDDTTTGEPDPPNVCIGLDQVGDIGSVYSLDGAPIDTTCEPSPMPCGGDVLGTWNVEDSCGYETIPNPLEADCPGSTFVVEAISHNGTIEFLDDGTFVEDFDIQTQVTIGLDVMTCFALDCATFEGFLQMETAGVTCEDMMGTCTCTFPPEMEGEQVTGNYQTMENDLLLEVDGEFQQLGYCVNGDRMDTWSPVFGATLTETMCFDENDCIDELGDTHEFYLCEPPEDGMG